MRATLWACILPLVAAGCVAPAPTPPSIGGEFSCGATCAVTIDDGPTYSWEPSIAVDPRDPQRLLAASVSVARFASASARPAWIHVHTSSDGGATWTSAPFPGGAGTATPDDPHATHTFLADPVALFLADGTTLLTYIADTTANAIAARGASGIHLFAARSTDGGRAWETPVQVAAGPGLSARTPAAPVGSHSTPDWEGHDKPWITAGPDGTLLLTWSWIHGPSWDCQIVQASSGDAGRSWSPLEIVDASGPCFSGPAPLATASAWHVAYIEYDEGPLYLATSRDRGSSWDIQELGLAAWMPFLRAGPGPQGERLWLAYPMDARGDGTEVPHLRWSDDDGATWSVPVALDAPTAPGRALVALDVAPDGTAYVAWLDHAQKGAGVTASLRAQAFDADGTPRRTLVVNADLATTGESVGDYIGLAATPVGAVLVYGAADAEGDLDLAFARVSAV